MKKRERNRRSRRRSEEAGVRGMAIIKKIKDK